MRMGYIYKITNPKGRIYIGRTKDISRRINDYKYLKCKSQPKIYYSLKKYGWEQHKFDIILRTENDRFAEVQLITYYNSFSKNGLNLTCGGEGGLETRKKISASKLGKPSNSKGIKWSVESKIKLSNFKTGKPSLKKVKVLQINKDNFSTILHDSITEASNNTKILVSSIANCLANRSKTAGGYIWTYNVCV